MIVNTLKIGLLAILVGLSVIAKADNSPFDAVRPIAEEGLRYIAEDGDKMDALLLLEEAMVRGQDWVSTENPDEIELMSQVVANIVQLRRELKGEPYEDLMLQLMIRSGVETVSSEKYKFGNLPNIYPTLEGSGNPAEGLSIEKALQMAVALMVDSDMKNCERVLLDLYHKTSVHDNDKNMRYKVANKLALFYLRLGMLDQAAKMVRQNKIEMDLNGICNNDYVETLTYRGFVLLLENQKITGQCFLDVCDGIARRLKLEPNAVMADYVAVMKAPAKDAVPVGQSDVDWQIKEFIKENDRNFYFLSESEREERWSLLKSYWNDLKTGLLNPDGSVADVGACLNAFQYEKQIMLRPIARIRETLMKSSDHEGVEMLDRLQQIKMAMAGCYVKNWKELQTEYKRIQKALMHNSSLNNLNDMVYQPLTTASIADLLRDNETFIDFGVIGQEENAQYYAVLITGDNPDGKAVAICMEKELKDYIDKTSSSSTREMVASRYDNDYLDERIWAPLLATGLIKEKVFYCPAGSLNSIMLDAISHDGMYIGEDIDFHILSSADSFDLLRKGESYSPKSIVSFCTMDYTGDSGESFIPLSDKDYYAQLTEMASKKGVNSTVYADVDASEQTLKSLSHKNIGALNISSHAFCLPAVGYTSIQETPYYVQLQSLNLEKTSKFSGILFPMYRTGLLLNGAERTWTGKNIIEESEDGILNGEELSAMDLRGADLVTLMACSTGDGDIDEYEGVMGLRRALKISGCGSLVTSAWNLDSEAAQAYLNTFYSNLLSGAGISTSHRMAQLELIKRFDDPYYWAVFQLVD